MKKYVCIIACVICLQSCKNQENSIVHSNVIDIEYGIEHLTTLKVSDFGKTIRYVPLETTDNSLVGSSPIIKVLRNYIVVECQERCMLFNKKDGSFVAEIGSFGQGPDEFTSNCSWTDEKEAFLYFMRRPNQLLQFDMKGRLSGHIRFSSSQGLASYYLLSDTAIIGYFAGINQKNQFALGFFDKEGNLNDTIPLLYSRTQTIVDEIANITVFKGANNSHYGTLAKSGIIVINYKNDQRQFTVSNAARVWKHAESIRFKEEFVDTVYTVSNKLLIPTFVFNTGKYHWSAEESTSTKNENDRILIADVAESDAFIFFQCIRGGTGLCNGLFDKKTGETKLGKNSDAIEDDLTQFMPFAPFGLSTSGEFFSLIEVHKIMEWLANHPEAQNNEKLSFLKELDEDANPIIILIE